MARWDGRRSCGRGPRVQELFPRLPNLLAFLVRLFPSSTSTNSMSTGMKPHRNHVPRSTTFLRCISSHATAVLAVYDYVLDVQVAQDRKHLQACF